MARILIISLAALLCAYTSGAGISRDTGTNGYRNPYGNGQPETPKIDTYRKRGIAPVDIRRGGQGKAKASALGNPFDQGTAATRSERCKEMLTGRIAPPPGAYAGCTEKDVDLFNKTLGCIAKNCPRMICSRACGSNPQHCHGRIIEWIAANGDRSKKACDVIRSAIQNRETTKGKWVGTGKRIPRRGDEHTQQKRECEIATVSDKLNDESKQDMPPKVTQNPEEDRNTRHGRIIEIIEITEDEPTQGRHQEEDGTEGPNERSTAEDEISGAIAKITTELRSREPQMVTHVVYGYDRICDHTKHDPKCATCTATSARQRKHIRKSAPEINAMSIDLCSLRKGGPLVLVATMPKDNDKDPIVIAIPIASKGEDDVREAILEAIAELEGTWKRTTIKRIHGDREPGYVAIKHDLSERAAVKVTFTTAHNPSANGRAESAVDRTSCRARAMTYHISDDKTREALWQDAMRMAGFVIAIQATPGEHGCDTARILPLTSHIMAMRHTDKEKRLDDRLEDAMYMYPAVDTSGAHWVRPIKEGAQSGIWEITGEAFLTTTMRTVLAEGSRRPRALDLIDNRRSTRIGGTEAVQCNECHKQRWVSKKHAKRLRMRGFHCTMLQDTECLTPEGPIRNAVPPRRGRPNKKAKVGEPEEAAHITKEGNENDSDTSLPPITPDRRAVARWPTWESPSTTKGEAYAQLHRETITDVDIEGEEDRNAQFVDLRTTENGEACHVTRLCTTQEKGTPEAFEAQGDETKKILGYSTWDLPIEKEDAIRKHRNDEIAATLCWVAMITSIKNIQRTKDFWKYKARIIALGHRVCLLLTGREHKYASDLWTPCSRLESIKGTTAYALIMDLMVRGVDLESFYLQTEWPADAEAHYVATPPEIRRHLPVAMRGDHLKKPGWRMARCMYGHPKSGYFSIKRLLEHLETRGWTPTQVDAAWLTRPLTEEQRENAPRAREITAEVASTQTTDTTGENGTQTQRDEADSGRTIQRPPACHGEMLSTYVDDLIAAIRRGSTLWQEVAMIYKFDTTQADSFPDIHLGQRMHEQITKCDRYRIIEFGMQDYANSIVAAIAALFGEEVVKAPHDSPTLSKTKSNDARRPPRCRHPYQRHRRCSYGFTDVQDRTLPLLYDCSHLGLAHGARGATNNSCDAQGI